MGEIIRGQAPPAGKLGIYLNKQSVPGQKIITVAQAISDLATVLLGASTGSSPADTGYINNRLRATFDGKLLDFTDILAHTWTNCFINDPTASDFTLEILRGSAFSDEEDRITVGQYNPFTPSSGFTQDNVINFHNFDAGASYSVWTQSFWKAIFIGDPQ